MNAIRAMFLTLISCIATSASAVTMCVTNTSQLQQAAAFAQANGLDDEIRLEAANFQPPAQNVQTSFFFEPADSDLSKTLKVSGGWKVGTNCGQQTPNATLTILNMQGKVGMTFRVYAPRQFLGSVTVENLSIVGSGSSGGWEGASALVWDVYAGGSAQFLADRLIMMFGNDSYAGAVLLKQSGGNTMTLRNSIIAHHATTDHGIQVSPVDVRATSGARGLLVNNSIHDNVGVGETAGLLVTGQVDLFNNVIANNATDSLVHYQVNSPSAEQISLVSNHISTQNLFPPPVVNEGNTTGPADWVMSGDYRILHSASNLRDSGFNAPTGGLAATDVFGNPRASDGAVDRGALEFKGNIVFRDGFE